MCFKCFSWDKNGKILAGDTLSNTGIKKKNPYWIIALFALLASGEKQDYNATALITTGTNLTHQHPTTNVAIKWFNCNSY